MQKERIEPGIASAQANIKYFGVLDHLEEAYMMPKYDYFTQVSEVVEILDTEQSGSYGLAKIACFQTYCSILYGSKPLHVMLPQL